MKAITLHQPWASFIAYGYKTIETRTHARFRSLVGETIAIHAGKKWSPSFYVLIGEVLPRNRLRLLSDSFQKGSVPFGAVVCTAKVVESRILNKRDSYKALINCDIDSNGCLRYGLFLKDIKKLDPPIPVRGKMGIWEWDHNTNR